MFRLRLGIRVELLSVLVLAVGLLEAKAHGQQLSGSEKSLVDTARGKYYDLKSAGFQSLRCSVKFDLGTVPLLPTTSDDPNKKLLERTAFVLALDSNGRPSFEHHYPEDATEAARQAAAQVTNLLTSFVLGVFQTWPAKGLQGPIPPFDSQIESVAFNEHGYVFSLRVPGGPVQVMTDKNYLVTDIVSAGGKLKEHPTYIPSQGGLVFSANEALDESHPENPVEVRYELGTTVIDGLQIPSAVHLQVNQNIDVRFVLSGCAVQKATVLRVMPPARH